VKDAIQRALGPSSHGPQSVTPSERGEGGG
jgi:hypothetical protein